ncbi:unnamed protein product [Musa acuminata var. zebrina]
MAIVIRCNCLVHFDSELLIAIYTHSAGRLYLEEILSTYQIDWFSFLFFFLGGEEIEYKKQQEFQKCMKFILMILLYIDRDQFRIMVIILFLFVLLQVDKHVADDLFTTFFFIIV